MFVIEHLQRRALQICWCARDNHVPLMSTTGAQAMRRHKTYMDAIKSHSNGFPWLHLLVFIFIVSFPYTDLERMAEANVRSESIMLLSSIRLDQGNWRRNGRLWYRCQTRRLVSFQHQALRFLPSTCSTCRLETAQRSGLESGFVELLWRDASVCKNSHRPNIGGLF